MGIMERLLKMYHFLPWWFRANFSRIYFKAKIETGVFFPGGLPLFRGNVRIGAYSDIGGRCELENVVIGKFCSIAQRVRVIGIQHNYKTFTTSWRLRRVLDIKDESASTEKGMCIIGNDVWIGQDVTIMGGVRIGNGAVIGAGSVVTKDVRPYMIMGGGAGQRNKKKIFGRGYSKDRRNRMVGLACRKNWKVL